MKISHMACCSLQSHPWRRSRYLETLCQLFRIDPGKRVSVSHIIMESMMMCANNWVNYGLKVVFVSLHITLSRYHHFGVLSEGIEYSLSCMLC